MNVSRLLLNITFEYCFRLSIVHISDTTQSEQVKGAHSWTRPHKQQQGIGVELPAADMDRADGIPLWGSTKARIELPLRFCATTDGRSLANERGTARTTW